MAALKRLAAFYMLLLAVVVVVHFVGTQFYDPLLEGWAMTAWLVIDPLMVAGLALVIIAAFARKRRVDAASDSSITREYLEANVLFFYSSALLLGLLWNWAGVQFSDPATTESLLWILIDSTLPLVLGVTACQLLREASA